MALSSTHKICWEEEVHVNKFGFCCSPKLWHKVKNSIFVQEAISWQFWKETIFNSPPLIRTHSVLTPQWNRLGKTRYSHLFVGVWFFITPCHNFSNQISRNEMWRFHFKDFYFHNLITLDTMSHILIWQITTFKLVWYAGYLFWK